MFGPTTHTHTYIYIYIYITDLIYSSYYEYIGGDLTGYVACGTQFKKDKNLMQNKQDRKHRWNLKVIPGEVPPEKERMEVEYRTGEENVDWTSDRSC